jgi:protein-L-isoaspartate(D-aspartate) O-methyltransferase
LTTNNNFPSAGMGAFDPKRLMSSGAYFQIQRRGTEFDARAVMTTAIIPCVSARDPDSEAALAAALQKSTDWARVKRLVRGGTVPEEQCWLRGEGWCLTYE